MAILIILPVALLFLGLAGSVALIWKSAVSAPEPHAAGGNLSRQPHTGHLLPALRRNNV